MFLTLSVLTLLETVNNGIDEESEGTSESYSKIADNYITFSKTNNLAETSS